MFTDIDMPGQINGLGLARLVSMRSQDLPIIVSSGAADVAPGDLPSGARFLAKPYSPSELAKLVAEMPAAAP
jgi:FixJ family two-component response regulator